MDSPDDSVPDWRADLANVRKELEDDSELATSARSYYIAQLDDLARRSDNAVRHAGTHPQVIQQIEGLIDVSAVLRVRRFFFRGNRGNRERKIPDLGSEFYPQEILKAFIIHKLVTEGEKYGPSVRFLAESSHRTQLKMAGRRSQDQNSYVSGRRKDITVLSTNSH